MSPSPLRTLIVIPTYNERGNLQPLVEDIQGRGLGVDFLIIDDHSSDGTGAVADELATRLPLTVLHRKGRLGIGSAHKAGLRYAMDQDYEAVMTMDADLSHSPQYLRPMLERLARADVVIGSRYVAGGGFERFGLHRLLLTKTVHRLTQSLLGLPYDCTSGLRAYRVAALRAVDFTATPSDGHAFLIESLFQIQRAGGTMTEYPITIQPRWQGQSKVSFAELLRAAASLMRLTVQRFSRRRRGASPAWVGCESPSGSADRS